MKSYAASIMGVISCSLRAKYIKEYTYLCSMYPNAKNRHSWLSCKLTLQMLAFLFHTQSNTDLTMEAAWHLFNPVSHRMHTQGMLSASPTHGIWFSRHPLSMHNPTEKTAPCDSDLPSSTVVHRLTLGKDFQAPYFFGGLRLTTHISGTCLPTVCGVVTSGDPCYIGSSQSTCQLLVSCWKIPSQLVNSFPTAGQLLLW